MNRTRWQRRLFVSAAFITIKFTKGIMQIEQRCETPEKLALNAICSPQLPIPQICCERWKMQQTATICLVFLGLYMVPSLRSGHLNQLFNILKVRTAARCVWICARLLRFSSSFYNHLMNYCFYDHYKCSPMSFLNVRNSTTLIAKGK